MLSFRSNKELFIEGQIGGYLSSFQIQEGKAGVPLALKSCVKATQSGLCEKVRSIQ